MDGAFDMNQPFGMTLAELLMVEPPKILVLVLLFRIDTDTVAEFDLTERIEVDCGGSGVELDGTERD